MRLSTTAKTTARCAGAAAPRAAAILMPTMSLGETRLRQPCAASGWSVTAATSRSTITRTRAGLTEYRSTTEASCTATTVERAGGVGRGVGVDAGVGAAGDSATVSSEVDAGTGGCAPAKQARTLANSSGTSQRKPAGNLKAFCNTLPDL